MCYISTHNVCMFRVSGYVMSDKLEIPRRKVPKKWYVGLHPDPVDRSQPNVHDDQLVRDAAESKMSSRKFHVFVNYLRAY